MRIKFFPALRLVMPHGGGGARSKPFAEQVPAKLGPTVEPLAAALADNQAVFARAAAGGGKRARPADGEAPEASAAAASPAFSATPKTRFSMLVPEVKARLVSMLGAGEGSSTAPLAGLTAVVCGIEAHVCVQQTVADLRRDGADVIVVADAVSSSRRGERATALRRIAAMGGSVASAEAAAFRLLGDASSPHFRAVSRMVRVRAATIGDADEALLA